MAQQYNYDNALYVDEPITKTPASLRRYRVGEIPGQQEQAQEILDHLSTPVQPRASRSTSTPQSTKPTTRRRATPMQTEPPRRRYEADHTTGEDKAIHPTFRKQQPKTKPEGPLQLIKDWWHNQHWLTHMGVGAVTFLTCGLLAVSGLAAAENSVFDPIFQAHTAPYLDVQVEGHSERLTPFLDSNNRVNLLVVQDGDASHAHVFPGPQLTPQDAKHAVLKVRLEGGEVVLVAIEPRYTSGFSIVQPENQTTLGPVGSLVSKISSSK